MTKQITPLAIVRLVVYILAALAGLAATVLTFIGMTDYAPILAAVSGAAATIAGGTAAYNINQTPQKLDLREMIVAFNRVADEAKALKNAAPAAKQDENPTNTGGGFSAYHQG